MGFEKPTPFGPTLLWGVLLHPVKRWGSALRAPRPQSTVLPHRLPLHKDRSSGHLGEVYLAFPCPFLHHRGYQKIWAEEVLILYLVRYSVFGEIEKEGPHEGDTLFASPFHVLKDIGLQPLPQKEKLSDDTVGFLSKRPDFVWPPVSSYAGQWLGSSG